jgi:hypothetical protein
MKTVNVLIEVTKRDFKQFQKLTADSIPFVWTLPAEDADINVNIHFLKRKEK